MNTGYLHHGSAPGPYRTEQVKLHRQSESNWLAFYMGRWRQVHNRGGQTYIIHQRERIRVQLQEA